MSGESPDPDVPDQSLADKLTRSRPAPRASFRGALGRYLAASDPGYGPRPARLWMLVGLYAAGGLLLILVGLIIALATG
jgi:hypothetical protein